MGQQARMNFKRLSTGLALFALISSKAGRADGLVARKSPFDPDQTMDRLVRAVEPSGLAVYARIERAAGAAKAGSFLRPPRC